ncbi:uncharacterized protein METZ01_LOCUS402462 [marine metagenome]|uniref:DUF4167 domain-containing protein n=1 Tax=marine metagenome TaxID=408172 RepID=A0A382VUR5_9ZZZZ
MVTFRNNNRRSNFRRNDRNHKRNGEVSQFKSHFPSKDGFQRKVPSRNNYNASKLVEKYNDLAREALSNGDKILSESYFQHADHFKRILKEQERNRIVKKTNEPVKELNDSKKTFDNKPNNSENNQESEKKIGLVKTIELANSKN